MEILKFYTPSYSSEIYTLTGKLQSVKTMDEADFVYLQGGADISPFIYSREKGDSVGVQYTRDIEEASVALEARIYNIPVFGICRGAQLLHTLNGGTLIKHLNGHQGQQHGVIYPETGEIAPFLVNSVHHQAIPPSEAIRMYGNENILLSEDGQATEAFYDEKRNVCGVQYHPEYTTCPRGAIEFAYNLIKQMVKMA
jgi:putative glutamine amidotransferase